MRTLCLLLAGLACGVPAGAHELQDNRALLIQRDKTHVSVTLFVAYAEALHLALAPVRPFAEFVAVHAAMKPEDLEKQLQKAQAQFQAGTKLQATGDVPLVNWAFPNVRQVQALLQQIVMQSVTDPTGHFHEEPTEIRADAVAAQEITAVRIRFAPEFQKVLVVAYRPTQLWVEQNTLSPAIRF